MSYVTIDGQDLSALIYAASALEGSLAPAVPARELETSPQGAPRLAQRLRLTPRTLTITVDVRAATLPLRQAVIDALTRRLAGVRRIQTSDAPERQWIGEGATVRARPVVNAANPLVGLDLEFIVPDPRAIAVEPTILALSATPVACPVGTAASAPVVRLFGASTPVVNPVVVLRAPSGAELARLSLTGSLGANTWLDIDARTQWLHLVSSGTRTVALSWLTGGAFPILDGADAAGVSGPWPTLALEATSGTPTGILLYRRSWA